MKKKLNICFIGGKQAGIIGFLTILSEGNNILAAVSYSKDLTNILRLLNIPVYKSKNDREFIKKLKKSDLLLCVHGREIIEKELFTLPKNGSVNIHPYLYKYKGADPVRRALKDKNYNASVGSHIIEQKVDEGRVLVEEFINVEGNTTVEGIYNKLYPYYCSVILKTLVKIKNES